MIGLVYFSLCCDWFSLDQGGYNLQNKEINYNLHKHVDGNVMLSWKKIIYNNQNVLNTRNVYDQKFLYGYECLKSISAIFQLYCGGLFCYWNKMKYMTKTKMLANPFP